MSARRKLITKLVNIFRPGYVYKTVNTVNGKKYIGSKLAPQGHKGTYFNENYYGSGVDLRKAIDKHGIDKFINVKQLDTRTINSMKKAEQGLLDSVDAAKDPMYYNRHNQYAGGGNVTDATRRKMSESHKGRKVSTETRRKISEANKGKKFGPLSQETKDNISKALKGKGKGLVPTKETREKISKAGKGRPPWNKGKKGVQKAWNAGMTKEEQSIYRQTKGLL